MRVIIRFSRIELIILKIPIAFYQSKEIKITHTPSGGELEVDSPSGDRFEAMSSNRI